MAVGLVVIWGLAATSWPAEASLGEIAVEGPSFTAPVGRTLVFLMTSTADGITFSVGAVGGMMVGAFARSLWGGRWRWEACEDPRKLGRQVGARRRWGWAGSSGCAS